MTDASVQEWRIELDGRSPLLLPPEHVLRLKAAAALSSSFREQWSAVTMTARLIEEEIAGAIESGVSVEALADAMEFRADAVRRISTGERQLLPDLG